MQRKGGQCDWNVESMKEMSLERKGRVWMVQGLGAH